MRPDIDSWMAHEMGQTSSQRKAEADAIIMTWRGKKRKLDLPGEPAGG